MYKYTLNLINLFTFFISIYPSITTASPQNNFHSILHSIQNEESTNTDNYDIDKRFISLSIITPHNNKSDYLNISSYNFLYYNSIAKHQNGYFSTILVLISINNTIYFSDIYGKIFYSHKFNFTINNILDFKSQDESHFYLVNSNKTTIYKYKFDSRKYAKDIPNDPNKKIDMKIHVRNNNTIDTYLTYEIYETYEHTLESSEFIIKLLSKPFIVPNNDVIEKMYTTKAFGEKTINILTQQGIIYIIKEFTMETMLSSNFSSLINNSTKILFFDNLIGFVNKTSPNIISFYLVQKPKYEYIRAVDSSINFNLISSFIYDTPLHLLFFTLETGDIYYVYLTHRGDSALFPCSIHYFAKTNIIIGAKGSSLFMLRRKDLVVVNYKNEIEFINYEGISDENEDEVFIRKRNVNINIYHNDKDNNTMNPCLIRTSLQHFMLFYNKNQNNLIVYTIPNIDSKINGGEDVGFNFKVPAIFVAFAVVFVVSFVRKRKEFVNMNKEMNSEEKSKNEVENIINKLGAFTSKKKYKED